MNWSNKQYENLKATEETKSFFTDITWTTEKNTVQRQKTSKLRRVAFKMFLSFCDQKPSVWKTTLLMWKWRDGSRLTRSCNGFWLCVNIYRKILGVKGQFEDGTASSPIIYSGAFQRIPFRWSLQGCRVFRLQSWVICLMSYFSKHRRTTFTGCCFFFLIVNNLSL